MKSEPDVFSIKDLQAKGTSLWDGVRNYQARNFMTQQMKVGDKVIFYHSSSEPPGAAGLAEVKAPAAPDPTQFDKKSEYFDPKAKPDKPIWFGVTVKFVREFSKPVALSEIRQNPKLADLPLLKRGNRLSIQPLTSKQYELLVEMADHA